MRSKQNKQPPPSTVAIPSEENLPFQLGDLVLCRYSTYPYWPATVDQTHQKERHGQYVCMHDTRAHHQTLAFWCTFSNEDTGGWVRADRMVLFHPSLLHYVRVRRNHNWYGAQQSAIEAALKAFHTIHKGSTPPPEPQPPADMLTRSRQSNEHDLVSDDDEPEEAHADKAKPPPDDDPMDLGSESSDDNRPTAKTATTRRRRSSTSAKSPRAAAVPKTPPRKKRKTITPRPAPNPRKRPKTAEQQLEAQLLDHAESEQVAALKTRISEMQANLEKLTSSLRRKEKALSDLRSTGNVVTFAPVKQDTVPIESMPKAFSGPVLSSDEFEHRVNAMRDLFDKLDRAAKVAHEKHQELSAEQDKIRKHYASLLEGVSDAQGQVVTHQKELADLLRGVLVSQVAVIDLRKHQAGNLIKTMSKMCKDMPNVYAFCNALYRGWKKQVVDYVHSNPHVADEEKKGKTPSAESKENGSAKAFVASKEGSGKGDISPKRTKGPAGNGTTEKEDTEDTDKEETGKREDSPANEESKAEDEMDVDSVAQKEQNAMAESPKKDVKLEESPPTKKAEAGERAKEPKKNTETEVKVSKQAKEEKIDTEAGDSAAAAKPTSKQTRGSIAEKKPVQFLAPKLKKREGERETRAAKEPEGSVDKKRAPKVGLKKEDKEAVKGEDSVADGGQKVVADCEKEDGTVKGVSVKVETDETGGVTMEVKRETAADEAKKSGGAKKEGTKVES